jgi:hypothetical protein
LSFPILTGELFALCPYDISGNSVEAVLDSSRYFVLRVESQDPSTGNKKKAYIGMGVSTIKKYKVFILLLRPIA